MSLDLEQVDDTRTQENFTRISKAVSENPFQGMTLLSLEFGKAETSLKVPHGLSFVPKDVIITQTQGAGSFSVDPSSTDRTNLVVTTTGACTVRLLVGTLGGT